MGDKLELTAETDGALWSVRTNGTVFLVVRTPHELYDVHAVVDGGVEYIGDAGTHADALKLIQAEIEG